MTFHKAKGKRLRDCDGRTARLAVVFDRATWRDIQKMSEAENVPASEIVRRGFCIYLANLAAQASPALDLLAQAQDALTRSRELLTQKDPRH